MTFKLNEYQLFVVQHLREHGVQFLVVGGVVRQIHTGEPTRDLDLWTDISDTNKARLAKALDAWADKYPSHVPPEGLQTYRLGPNVQIPLPCNDALYLDKEGEMQEIKYADRVDILTSYRGLEFNGAWQFGSDWLSEGVRFRLLSLEDVPPKRSDKDDEGIDGA